MAKLYKTFKNGDIILKLIFINIILFLLYLLIHLSLLLFNINIDNDIINIVSMPSNIKDAIKVPWSIITYMFIHKNIAHIMFNMLGLYWFGKMFLSYFNEKQLFGLYLLGGIGGALLFLFAFNTLPYFKTIKEGSILLGASASILAIMSGVACYNPNYEIKFMFIGKIKLIYIAIAFFIISFYNISDATNAGGNIAHVGGLLIGWIYAILAKKGIDLTKWLNNIIDFFVNLFSQKPKMKVEKRSYQESKTYEKHNNSKETKDSEMNLILEKIKRSGYNSLTIDEKKKLFGAGQE